MRRAICAAAVLLAVSCAADPKPAATVPTTTAAVVTTTTLSEAEREELAAAAAEAKQFVKKMNRTPSSSRPAWCRHYDAWKRAVDEQDDIAARYGSKVTAWPSGVLDEFDVAVDAMIEAADVLWAGTEAGTVPRGWDARARACR